MAPCTFRLHHLNAIIRMSFPAKALGVSPRFVGLFHNEEGRKCQLVLRVYRDWDCFPVHSG